MRSFLKRKSSNLIVIIGVLQGESLAAHKKRSKMKKLIKKIVTFAFAAALCLSICGTVGYPKTVNAEEATKTRATLTLGDARWATGGTDAKVGDKTVITDKNLISWDLSVLDVTCATAKGNQYKGYVWNSSETEKYLAVLAILENEVVVDTTSCKAALYVDTTDTTFIIKKDEVFTIYNKTAADQPDEIVMLKNYLVTYTPDTSRISTTDMDAKSDDGDGGADVTPPVINYDGETSLSYTEGDCVPLVFATAEDAIDGNVLVKSVWSEGSHDENYKLLAGTHTLTLCSVDASGNTAEIEIKVTVKSK